MKATDKVILVYIHVVSPSRSRAPRYPKMNHTEAQQLEELSESLVSLYSNTRRPKGVKGKLWKSMISLLKEKARGILRSSTVVRRSGSEEDIDLSLAYWFGRFGGIRNDDPLQISAWWEVWGGDHTSACKNINAFANKIRKFLQHFVDTHPTFPFRTVRVDIAEPDRLTAIDADMCIQFIFIHMTKEESDDEYDEVQQIADGEDLDENLDGNYAVENEPNLTTRLDTSLRTVELGDESHDDPVLRSIDGVEDVLSRDANLEELNAELDRLCMAREDAISAVSRSGSAISAVRRSGSAISAVRRCSVR